MKGTILRTQQHPENNSNGAQDLCVSSYLYYKNLSLRKLTSNGLGATGYIGGDALYALVHSHPEYEIACLVRNSDKGAQVASQYGKVRLVYGSLDDGDILGEEAKKADIVLSALAYYCGL